MSLRGFSTISFWATDVQAAADWYAKFLGFEPYFIRSGPDGKLAYAEFRIGDHQHELGIIDGRYSPSQTAADPAGLAAIKPAGAVMYWHVDDLAETVERLLSMGATEYQPITARGDSGFVTASVVDPFGNVLGVMTNPHYLDVLGSAKDA
ncbi:VOC family protein [Arthrobacter sp. 35W]|uniref:VOC family protein n=1 Tax=Arthrobacter sp. 35W TaxID=1132441 RepID=UPI0004174B7F|nr:VOC family protein [Arthrobacter sp. 35W]